MELRARIPLVDAGLRDPAYRGILSPEYPDELIGQFIHEPFLKDASLYAARYQSTDYWKGLIRQAQRHFTLGATCPLVLDIGSGAGNTVFPLLDLYPGAAVVASDLSLPLLKLLKDHLDQHYPQRDCQVVQLNAESLDFEDNQFDLICGGAILHQLFHPERTIAECQRVLKPGGAAIFFEPFEIGSQTLALMLETLLAMNHRFVWVATWRPRLRRKLQYWVSWAKNCLLPLRLRPLMPGRVRRLFEGIIEEYRVRRGRDHSPEQLRTMDDKQLFTRGFLEQQARSSGFGSVVIEALNQDEALFSKRVEAMLRLGLGLGKSALPGWAWSQLRQLDEHFSQDLMPELMIEGLIVYRKPEAALRSAA